MPWPSNSHKRLPDLHDRINDMIRKPCNPSLLTPERSLGADESIQLLNILTGIPGIKKTCVDVIPKLREFSGSQFNVTRLRYVTAEARRGNPNRLARLD